MLKAKKSPENPTFFTLAYKLFYKFPFTVKSLFCLYTFSEKGNKIGVISITFHLHCQITFNAVQYTTKQYISD